MGYDLFLPEPGKDGRYIVFEDGFSGTQLNERIEFGESYTGNQEIFRLTVETDAGDGWDLHGQKIGQFSSEIESEFCVDYIKVWQNENYEQYVIDDSYFAGTLDKES